MNSITEVDSSVDISSSSSPIRLLIVGDSRSYEKKFAKGELVSSCFSIEIDSLISKMTKAMNLNSGDLYRTLLIKCALKNSDIDEESYVENCLAHFYDEVLLVRPKVIVTLGAMATHTLLNVRERMSLIQGEFYPYKIEQSGKSYECSLMPIYHPELLLINPEMIRIVWQSLQKVMDIL